jgi:hypothetical protein
MAKSSLPRQGAMTHSLKPSVILTCLPDAAESQESRKPSP